ncbi:hypothetical protein B0I37DRAFT_381853 [Chaetomium sp. MPI-CAGE-AT-0009]|nr:hypothetical protein B0I37DRAFT_381853 [Chaetomium sp. MPI-CAGE-AT-0009]
MSSHTTTNGQVASGVPPNSSTDRPQPGQGAQPQSIAPRTAPSRQPTLNQGESSGRAAPSRQPTLNQGESSGRPAPQRTSSSTSVPQGTGGIVSRPAAATTAAETRPPSRSGTASTVSTAVQQHNTFMPEEHIAKLSGEVQNRERQAAIIEAALNRYKKSIDAEGKAKKAYTDEAARIAKDTCMTGRDYFSAQLVAVNLANTWEKAAASSRFQYQALKRAMEG